MEFYHLLWSFLHLVSSLGPGQMTLPPIIA